MKALTMSEAEDHLSPEQASDELFELLSKLESVAEGYRFREIMYALSTLMVKFCLAASHDRDDAMFFIDRHHQFLRDCLTDFYDAPDRVN
jgi:hypothetical protein